MDWEKVHQDIRSRRDADLATWVDLVSQPSVSAQDLGVRECAEVLARMMEKMGIRARIMETGGQPVVFGQVDSERPEAPTVLFYGHYDVQPPEPLEKWISPPFEPQVREGRLYGRGTGDNKGQLLAHVLAVRSYLESLGQVPVNVKFLFEGEEESGSPNLASFAQEHQDLLKTDLVYTSDGPMHENGDPVIFFGVRGLLSVDIVVETATSDNHSGNKGGVIPNAAWELVEILQSLRDDAGRPAFGGFWEGVRPPTQTELELVGALPFDPQETARVFGVDKMALTGEEFYRRLLLEPTLSINGLVSGYTGEGTKTIIPGQARAKLDMRLVPDQDPHLIAEGLQEHVARVNPRAQVIHGKHTWPSRTDPQVPVARKVVRAVEKERGRKALILPSLGGSMPDYVFTRILGAPSLGIPYANADEANHAPNENMDLELFFSGIHVSARVLEELSGDL